MLFIQLSIVYVPGGTGFRRGGEGYNFIRGLILEGQF